MFMALLCLIFALGLEQLGASDPKRSRRLKISAGDLADATDQA